jgi:signal transduction histidine kinase
MRDRQPRRPFTAAAGRESLDRGIHTGLAVLRVAAWAWLAAVTVLERDDLRRPALAAALLAGTLAWSLASFAVARPLPAVDLVVGAVLLAADRHVYDGEHPQSFGGAWPLAPALAAGVCWGPAGGAATGVVLGAARWAGAGGEPAVISLVSSTVLFVLAGVVAGDVATRLRRAESAVAAARAREEVARTLHDGVLQTLAVVQRRAAGTDAELAALARDQERELRAWLTGDTAGTAPDLATALRDAARRVEEVHGLRTTVVVADDLPDVATATVAAVAGAVGEALVNAAKHAGGTRATVYAEPTDDGGEVFVSVKDDGHGFDDAATAPGLGTTRSIRGRVAEVGGRVEVDGNPGRGTEVRVWVSPR